MRLTLRPLAILLLGSALAACTGTLPRLAGGPEPDPQAESMLRWGDYEGARQRYEFLARTAPVPDYYWLRAADAAFRGGDGQSAQQLVEAIRPNELDRVDRNQYLLLASRLDLNAGRAREAMTKLNALSGEHLEGGQAINYHTARASAYNQLGDMLASAKERVILGPMLTSPDAVKKNNDAIYDALRRLPPSQLQERQAPPPDVLGGWTRLTLLLKTTPAAELPAAVDGWRAAYPRHPANGPFLQSALADAGTAATVAPLRAPAASSKSAAAAPAPAPVPMAPPPSGPFAGVLLPLSGPLAPAAEAIRTGMTAAYFADPNPSKPQLHFVDTEAGDVRDLYRQLAAAGATAVVGPLVKDNVSELAASGDLSVPVLALNQVPGAYNSKLYQFGLTPEHEAEQAAGSAWFDGRQNALVLAPNSALGQRMVKHFTAYWKSLGGKVLAVKTYTHHGQDFSTPVKNLLAGQSSMESSTGSFVFLVADAKDAKLIVPQLAAQGGSTLPVYALSQVYDGKQDPELKGVIFCDIPWLLNPDEGGALSARALDSQIQQTQPEVVKLIAMGLDAYRLVPVLDRFSTDSLYRFPGATGNLSLQSGNRFQRQLECAQFENGQLQLRGQAPMLQPAAPTSPTAPLDR
jgi:outer membrane PBP1 activator LpoA protein